MFLIEYEKGVFIDAKTINWISINGIIKFTTRGDSSDIYTVGDGMEVLFLNNLQSLNTNISDIAATYHESTKEQ